MGRALGIGVQIFEMTSMLVLFLNFYSGAYRKSKGSKTTTGNSQTKPASTKVLAKETDNIDAPPSSQSSLSSDSDEDAIAKKEL
jgi:hypothetical protein